MYNLCPKILKSGLLLRPKIAFLLFQTIFWCKNGCFAIFEKAKNMFILWFMYFWICQKMHSVSYENGLYKKINSLFWSFCFSLLVDFSVKSSSSASWWSSTMWLARSSNDSKDWEQKSQDFKSDGNNGEDWTQDWTLSKLPNLSFWSYVICFLLWN